MAGLPKKYARMGFKRGWAAFNRSHKKKKRGVIHMAKRKRKKSYFKKKARSITKGFTMGNVIKVLAGAALAALYEVFVSPMIPLNAMIKNVIELVIGLILASMSGMPMPVRAFGAALATVNAYSLIVPMVQGWAGGTSASGSSW